MKWEGRVCGFIEVLSRNLLGATEKNYKIQSLWEVNNPGFELSTS
jgi:hypothetical protein